MDIPKKTIKRAISIVEFYGYWSYAKIQRTMGIPYHEARPLKEKLRELGVIDNGLKLILKLGDDENDKI